MQSSDFKRVPVLMMLSHMKAQCFAPLANGWMCYVFALVKLCCSPSPKFYISRIIILYNLFAHQDSVHVMKKGWFR